MLAKRIIPCLDIDANRVVKGVRFQNLKDAGDPVFIAREYQLQGADELVFLDITASSQNRPTVVELVRRVAKEVFIPFSVGGGIKTVDDARALLEAGADKVCVNTSAVQNPELISALAYEFGSQCVVLAVDVKRIDSAWRVYIKGGKVQTQLDALEWLKRAQDLGAGEILLTSMDRDGTKLGYDEELLRACSFLKVPIIASGGAGRMEHFLRAFELGADACLAASLFHFGEVKIPALKLYLKQNGINVRINQNAR
ncbi:MAG: imidazole glycerol phosphate synthase subunit HisF [Aquificaceae bacterium]|nr:imidazole glycerol phosphate synthase subunit HisF [Aquificaceae bacterium]MDW8237000.1 imidazole glycerol phosphate synthase subunit HisF [Aquificaceae bacterium]